MSERRKIEKADPSELVPWEPCPGSVPLWIGVPFCLATLVGIITILLGWW